MEKIQIKSDWVFTCKFSAFAQAYTGLESKNEIIEEMDQSCCLWSVHEQETIFLEEDGLLELWDEQIEIRLKEIMENGIVTLSLSIPDLRGLNLECDCSDLKYLFREIASLGC